MTDAPSRYTAEERAEIKKWAQSLYWLAMGDDWADEKFDMIVDQLFLIASKPTEIAAGSLIIGDPDGHHILYDATGVYNVTPERRTRLL